MSKNKNFSLEEINYIKSNYRTLFDDEIAEHLNRPIGSITRKRQRLGCWHVQQEVSSSLKGEIWKQIKDLPEGYQVSNFGRIKTGKKLCSLYITDSGYVQWRVVNKSISLFKTFRVHRLVAMHFIDTNKTIEECDVHHIDHNKSNNVWWNLEWLTKEEHLKAHGA